MSGIYTVPFSGAVTTAIDLAEVVAHTNKVLVIVGWVLFQTSDFGDAQEEILTVTLKSGQTVSGSLGSVPTIGSNDPSGGSAAGFTAKAMNTTLANTGTITSHQPRGWNVRMEQDIILPETEQVILGGGRRATLELSAPVDSLTVGGYLKVQEIG